jgi:hypothetical protein
VNNVYVSACNLGLDARAFIAGMPRENVGEIHLAGHTRISTAQHGEVLVDDHGSSVCDEVWELYRFAIARLGPLPTLIEWDSNIPELARLVGESQRADRILGECPGIAA